MGYSDGGFRFVSENRVLINYYSVIDPAYGVKLRTLLEKNELEVETLPIFEEDGGQRRGNLPTAVGIYINYLRVGDFVVVPGYLRQPVDQLAKETIQTVLPNASVFQLPWPQFSGHDWIASTTQPLVTMRRQQDSMIGTSTVNLVKPQATVRSRWNKVCWMRRWSPYRYG